MSGTKCFTRKYATGIGTALMPNTLIRRLDVRATALYEINCANRESTLFALLLARQVDGPLLNIAKTMLDSIVFSVPLPNLTSDGMYSRMS